VLIVLDQFSRSQRTFPSPEFTTYLYPELIKPILEGALGAVCVVMALREGESGSYGLTGPTGLRSSRACGGWMSRSSRKPTPSASLRVLRISMDRAGELAVPGAVDQHPRPRPVEAD
jgi:hypothetical protein